MEFEYWQYVINCDGVLRFSSVFSLMTVHMELLTTPYFEVWEIYFKATNIFGMLDSEHKL